MRSERRVGEGTGLQTARNVSPSTAGPTLPHRNRQQCIKVGLPPFVDFAAGLEPVRQFGAGNQVTVQEITTLTEQLLQLASSNFCSLKISYMYVTVPYQFSCHLMV